MRRALLIGLALLLAACPQQRLDSAGLPYDGGTDDRDHGPSNNKSSCKGSADCVPAAATCCDCPAFAISVDDPTHRACAGVSCPVDNACPDNVTAACEGGFCVLACVQMVCPESCAMGYTVDPTGCLSCACASVEANGCTMDADCVATRADCCGCAQGGSDTAVLATGRSAFDAALGCDTTPNCPQVPACEPDATPRCIQGRCVLASSDLPLGACGRPDLPACPGSTVCAVNASDSAGLQGVGVCVPL